MTGAETRPATASAMSFFCMNFSSSLKLKPALFAGPTYLSIEKLQPLCKPRIHRASTVRQNWCITVNRVACVQHD
jgi:hypothetical protein